MPYRPISQTELDTIHAHIQTGHRWQEFVDFALKFYGPKSHKIVVEFGDHYNDQGYEAGVFGVAVFDADGNELDIDLTSPEVKEYADNAMSANRSPGSFYVLHPEYERPTEYEIAEEWIGGVISYMSGYVNEDDEHYEERSYPTITFYVNRAPAAVTPALYVYEVE